MILLPESRESTGHEPSWTTRLVWGVLLAWLSPVLLIVMAIGLVGVAVSGSAGLAAKSSRARDCGVAAPLAGPVNRAA